MLVALSRDMNFLGGSNRRPRGALEFDGDMHAAEFRVGVRLDVDADGGSTRAIELGGRQRPCFARIAAGATKLSGGPIDAGLHQPVGLVRECQT